ALQIMALPELIELHLDSGIEQAQLHKKFMCDRRRFGKSQDRWKEVRKIKIEITQGLDEFVERGGLRVGEIDLAIDLFTQGAPIEFDERMLLGDFADDGIGDAGAFAEAGEMELAHFTAAAHVVHQVIGVSFTANKGHLPSSANLPVFAGDLPPGCSVKLFHYEGQVRRRRIS
ncbi:MAG: hypothetical protein WAK48_30440, partial [Candidatus Acidiferrum sp.]